MPRSQKGSAVRQKSQLSKINGEILDPVLNFSPHLQITNPIDRSSFREWTSTSTKTRSIDANTSNVWFTIESQSTRSLFDPTESFLSFEVDISSGNANPLTTADHIVPPNGLFWLREFSHSMNSKPIARVLGDAFKAYTALSLTMDPKTNQSSSYFYVFPNSNTLSDNSLDVTNGDYNKKYYEINQAGIDQGSAATRKFIFTIPLSVLSWPERPSSSDIATALPDVEHEFRFDLKERSQFANNILYSINTTGSVPSIDSSSFDIKKMTIWAKYVEPTPASINQFTKNTLDDRMLFLSPDHVILRNRTDSKYTGERISTYSTMVNKVIVWALVNSPADAENPVATGGPYVTNSSVEFNGVRVYSDETSSDYDRYMRNYLISGNWKFNDAKEVPLTFNNYRKAYKSLQVFDLSDIAESKLSTNNELYFSGDVENSGTNYDLHFIVLRHSYIDLIWKDQQLTIENTVGI